MKKKYIVEVKNIEKELKDMNPEKLIRWAFGDIFEVSLDDIDVVEG